MNYLKSKIKNPKIKLYALSSFFILAIILASCGSGKQYTRYTPGMLRQDNKTICPVYKNTKPLKRKNWQRYAKYEKPKESSAIVSRW
ncbi:MAG: hypothetical protein ACFB2Y_09880 [Fulvivirga sp.]